MRKPKSSHKAAVGKAGSMRSVGKADEVRSAANAGKGDAGKATASRLDFDAIRKLALIADEFGLTEVEADPSGHVRIARSVGGAGDVGAGQRPSVPAIALAPSAPVEGASEPGTFVSSPFVGTFYRAASPDSAAFVEVGQKVKKGQVVCIVEAMKLMNEIEAEADGKVAEILAKNGEHVEYGQGLIRLTPL
jgi:acetyl-CoA carboxylase biotin carboxyl carrier protein